MKKCLVLALGFCVMAAGLLFAKEAKVLPAAFTLANSGGTTNSIGPAMFFSLAAATTGPGGSAYSEGCETMNTWFGCDALFSNRGGNWNTVFGSQALFYNSTGNYNTASGWGTLYSNSTGSYNTASGPNALFLNSEGSYNTASGYQALYSNSSGSYNTALGYNAGYLGGTGNYNIFIGANSMAVDATNTIVIGTHYQPAENPPIGQNRTFIAGIVGTALTEADWPTVVGITPAGRLGTMSDDLLPSKGDKGDPGEPGPQGPAGEGLVSGSLLFLRSGFSPPAGYTFLGTTDLILRVPGSKGGTKLTVNVYQKP